MPYVYRRFFVCLVLFIAVLLLVPGAAIAQSEGVGESRHYSVTAGSLDDALNQFALQAEITLTFSPQLVAGKMSRGLQGDYSLASGLAELLAGTELSPISNDGKVYILVKANAVSEANAQGIMLGPVRVQGATSASDEVYQTAGSVNVITRDKIERFRGTSVGDIFQGVAGVLIGENRNSGGLDVNIRGMQGQGRVPVLVDGSRQETTVYRGYAGVIGRSYIDPDLIGSIRIDKGPVLTAEGAGATGGVVNVNTIGVKDIIKPGKDWGIRMRGAAIGNNTGSPVEPGTVGGFVLGFGSGDDLIYRTRCARDDICSQMHTSGLRSYELPDTFTPTDDNPRPDLLDPKSYAGSLSLAKQFSWGDVIAAYSERSQGNYYAGKNGNAPYLVLEEVRRTPLYTEVKPTLGGSYSRFRAEELIINSNFSSNSLLLKTVLAPSDDQVWELSYIRYDSEYGELMPSQLLWFGLITQTAQSTVLAHTYTSRYHWDAADKDWLDLRVNVWHTNTTSENNSYSEDIQNMGGFVPSAEPELYRRWGTDISNTQHFYPWWNLKLNYGFALQQERAEPKEKPTDWGLATSSTYLRDAERDEWSAFFSTQFQPFKNLTIEAGTRYIHFDTHDNNANAAAYNVNSPYCVDDNQNGHCDPIYTNYKGSGTAPVVSATWEPLAGLQFYGRYAEALRMPSLFESSGGFSAMPSLEIDLRPEHAKNNELGINYLSRNALFDNDKLGVKFAVFQNDNRDYLTRANFNTWENGESSAFISIRNIDRAQFHGVELSLDYDMNWLYSQISATRYNKIAICHYGSYRREACTDYGVANSYINNMIPPDWHGSWVLGTRLFGARLDTGLRATFMGERNNPRYDNDTRRGMLGVTDWQDYQLLDFYLTWKHNDSFSIDFNIDNLTDRYYLDALSLGLVPSPGRTAKLSFTLHL